MKLLIFSDSHGRVQAMLDAVKREAPNAVLHLGDCVEDARQISTAFTNLQVWYVRGNNDYRPDTVATAVITPANVPFFLCHGHTLQVYYGIDRLVYAAQEANCQVALFGHTHRPYYEDVAGLHVLNPGSISLPRGGNAASYVRMDLQDGQVRKITFLRADGKPFMG